MKRSRISAIFIGIILLAVSPFCSGNIAVAAVDPNIINSNSISDSAYASAAGQITDGKVKQADALLKNQPYAHFAGDIRKFPYPYKAMLSITSDIDDTTLSEFETYHRFLNTEQNTRFGRGLGLDIGDSFWVYMGSNLTTNGIINEQGQVMTWFSGVDTKKVKDAQKIKHYFDCGWIDSIHTFGDFSHYGSLGCQVPTRAMAAAAWQALKAAKVTPKIWIDHGDASNIQNFGGYNAMRITRFQQGDLPGAKCYHTDLTIKDGIHYVWNGMTSNQFGMNDPLYPITLRDGNKVWGFRRYTNIYARTHLVWIWNPYHLNEQINKANLDKIAANGQYSIVATHFGASSNAFPFCAQTLDSLKLLQEYQNAGSVLVTRTSRLLDYCLLQNYVKYAMVRNAGETYIDIKSIDDPIFGSEPATIKNTKGLTFYVSNAAKTVLLIQGAPVPSDELVTGFEKGKELIGIKWFAPDYTDYSEKQQPL